MMMMLTCCLHSLSLRAKSPRKKALGQLHHRAAAAAAVTAAVVADLSLENKKKRENQIQIAGAVLEWQCQSISQLSKEHKGWRDTRAVLLILVLTFLAEIHFIVCAFWLLVCCL